MQEEIWKVYNRPITTKVKSVEVSNYGNVKVNGRLIDLSKLNNSRYYCAGGYHIHRMVAELFVPNPDNKPEVDHIDTNKHNNHFTNLRWVTRSENMMNSLTHERILNIKRIGHIWSEKSRKKLSKTNSGTNHRGSGWNLTEETKQLISETRKNMNIIPYCKGRHRVYDNIEHTKYHYE